MADKLKIELNIDEAEELEKTLDNELGDPLVGTNTVLIKSALKKLQNAIKNRE